MRSWRTYGTALALALAMAVPAAATGATLYVSSARGYMGGNNRIGWLYQVELPEGRQKSIGATRIGNTSVGVAGLARNPRTGVLYGITSPSTPEFASRLVTLDPATAVATPIGPLGAAATDINFDAKGRLFAWLSELHRLGEIDLSTGKVTPLDIPGLEGEAGSIAIDGSGNALLAMASATGKLVRVDLAAKRVVSEVALVGAPYNGPFNALTLSPEGLLVGINSDGALPPRSMLVNIDSATGRVSAMSDLPQDADGLAFALDAPGAEVATYRSQWMRIIAAVLGFAVLVFFVVRARRRK